MATSHRRTVQSRITYKFGYTFVTAPRSTIATYFLANASW